MSLARRVTQPVPASNEPELVAAVRRGDDRAFEELYARYRSRIGSYILGMVGDHGRAEDIAQEVFISALRRLRENDRTIIFKPWIYEIAKNACIDEFRRTRRIHEVPLEADDDREFPAAGLPSTSPTPDVAVESKQRLTDLRGAFRGLSESHHRILVLRELEGLSYNQIGDRLGMSKPVVESTLFRARRRLGEEFEELESGRRCERVQSLIASDHERPVRSLGIRERRQFARHVGHCELCLRQARDASIDEALYRAPNLLGRLAVLAPVTWLRSAMHYFDSAPPAAGAGRAIAAAAIVVAGAGASGGFVSYVTGPASRPPHAVPAAPVSAGGMARQVSVAERAAVVARPPDRYGVVQAAVLLSWANGLPAAATTHALGLRTGTSTPSQPRGHAVRFPPGGGLSYLSGTIVAAPTNASGSQGPAASQPQSGAPQSEAPLSGTPPGGAGQSGTPQGGAGESGAPQMGAPSIAAGASGSLSSSSGLNLGQTGSTPLGAVNQGIGSLPVTPGPLPGASGSGLLSGTTGSGSTQIPSLPSLPPSASGGGSGGGTGSGSVTGSGSGTGSSSSAGGTSGTGAPSGSGQPPGGGAGTSTAAAPPQNGSGQTAPSVSAPGASQPS